ncbi:O-antigen ligase family protein [Patescibacteria group bacterium]
MLQKKLKNKLFAKVREITPLKLSRFFIYAFILFLPFQINVVTYTTFTFDGGNFNPFTSVFIYLTDFLFLFAFIFWAGSIFTREYKEKITYGNPIVFLLFFIFLIVAEVSVLFAYDQFLAFSLVIRLFEFMLVYFFLINKVVRLETLINFFLISVVFQAVVAILQYIFQSSIGLGFLGESTIGPEVEGVAKIDVGDEKVMRAYGTLPHPNILAGYLLTGIILTFHKLKTKVHFALPVLITLVAAFILAFSRGAFLAILVAALIYYSIKDTKLSFKYLILIAVGLFFMIVLFNLEQTFFSRMIFSDAASFNERVMYFNISKYMMYLNPFGIGIGNFTLALPEYTALNLAPWQFQPVHNAYMLVMNELGIHGAVIFLGIFGTFAVSLFKKMKKSIKSEKVLGALLIAALVGIFVVGLFDHYTFSLYPGLGLLFIIFSISGKYFSKEIY